MRIIEDVKLDYKDVLITPKRSTLSSRSQVKLERLFNFRSGNSWFGVPIIAANMDGVGTLSMAQALAQHGLFTCLIKTYNTDIENYGDFRLHHDHYAISTGVSVQDFRNLGAIITGVGCQFICIYVANGYIEKLMTAYSKILDDRLSMEQ